MALANIQHSNLKLITCGILAKESIHQFKFCGISIIYFLPHLAQSTPLTDGLTVTIFTTAHFLPRDASAERGNATVSRLSVRLSVCLSVCLSVRDV